MTTGLRARKKEATRETIADATLALACEVGPDVVTVEQIAEAADVSPRTFFNYFGSKEDALFSMRPGRLEEMLATLQERPDDEPSLDALRAALVVSTDSFTEQAERWSRRLRLVREHPYLLSNYLATYSDIEDALVRVLAQRLGADPDRDLSPKLFVGVAVAALRIAVNHWQEAETTRSLEELVDEAFTTLTTGLEGE